MTLEELPEVERLAKEDKSRTKLYPSFRLVIACLSFTGLFLSAQSQSAMGATLICMVINGSDNNTDTFDWNKRTQGWIISARFLANYFGQLPSGYLTSFISRRMMATIGFIVMGAFDVMTVPCAISSLTLLIVTRVMQGFGNVWVTIACYDVLGKWVPSHESSVLIGFTGIGFYAGASMAFAISAFVCENASWGWPWAFYFAGSVTIFFSAVWYTFASDDPASSSWVGQKEKDYVMACKKKEVFHGKIPWKDMVVSGPLYAIALGQIAGDWLGFFFLTVAPTFFTDILLLSRGYADLVCGIPLLLMIPVCVVYGRLSDELRHKHLLSTAGIRRLAQGIGNLVPAICCVLLALLPASHTIAAVAVYLMCILAFSTTTSGWMTNITDLAPQLVGATFSLSQTLGLWTSFVVPVLVDYLTEQRTKEGWDMVFYITASVQLICFVGFCTLASGQVQPWATSEERIFLNAHDPVVRRYPSK